jgi:hypothetical protein
MFEKKKKILYLRVRWDMLFSESYRDIFEQTANPCQIRQFSFANVIRKLSMKGDSQDSEIKVKIQNAPAGDP